MLINLKEFTIQEDLEVCYSTVERSGRLVPKVAQSTSTCMHCDNMYIVHGVSNSIGFCGASNPSSDALFLAPNLGPLWF